MSTVSTNIIRGGTFLTKELALIFLSIASFSAALLPVTDIMQMGTPRVLGLYALGMVLLMPVISNPYSAIGGLISSLMKFTGFICYVLGAFLLIPYILGVAIVLGKEGLFAANAFPALLWLPVYFGLPALVSMVTSERGDQ